jgi:molybdenum cofactor cytidylyltransferase
MRFGPLPPREAVGGVAAHAIRTEGFVLKKGTVVSEADAEALEKAGIHEVVVARLDPGDVGEDIAAERLAHAMAGPEVIVEAPFTGRSNLFAATAGVLVIDAAAVDELNNLDEAVALATLPAFKPVEEGEMIGTMKIVPFAIAGDLLAKAEAVCRAAAPLMRVAPWRGGSVGVVSTMLPGLQEKVVKKTLRVLDSRLEPAGAHIGREVRVPHETAPLTEALKALEGEGHDMVLVFGASAVTDRRDVVPAAIEAAGGKVEHLGMPVDPGQLLVLGRMANGKPVLGAPGCARSPKENGFDWVLHRLLAGIPVTPNDIKGMGLGGLLMEIVSRPQPRAEKLPDPHVPKVGAVLLAAGRGTRMGGPNKLLAEVDGKPLVRHAAEAALAAGLAPIVLVTGHQNDAVERALADLPLVKAHNPAYAEGLSTSLRAGLAALPDEIDGAVVLLGDMPRVDAGLIKRLVAAFRPDEGKLAVVPVRDGDRGNPVLFARRFFPELLKVTGDVGGRGLLGEHGEAVVEVPVEGEGAFVDVDTPEALAALRGEAMAK